jgi:hypothetical protein
MTEKYATLVSGNKTCDPKLIENSNEIKAFQVGMMHAQSWPATTGDFSCNVVN